MNGILVVAFWCWFVVSLGILFRRAVRKASGRNVQPPTDQPTAASVRIRPPEVAPNDPSTFAAVAGEGRAGTGSIFVREPAATPSDRGGTADRAGTIADALQGIRMPCDLMPLTGGQADFERRAAFVTVGYPAAAVAPEVADEVERLGMAFNALSDTTAVAEREDVRVKIAVRTVGPSVDGIADPLYPTAPEHSVVVEFELA